MTCSRKSTSLPKLHQHPTRRAAFLPSLYVVGWAAPTVGAVVAEVRGSASGREPRTRLGPATTSTMPTSTHFATIASTGSPKSPLLATSGDTRNRLVAP